MDKRYVKFGMFMAGLIFLLFTLFGLASLYFHDKELNYDILNCSDTYRNVTVCNIKFNSNESAFLLPGGFYINKTIYVVPGRFTELTLRHEYCHYEQDVLRNETIGFWQELECYYKGYGG